MVCSFYLNMSKSDHREGGITFESAKAANFGVPSAGTSNNYTVIEDAPKI